MVYVCTASSSASVREQDAEPAVTAMAARPSGCFKQSASPAYRVVPIIASGWFAGTSRWLARVGATLHPVQAHAKLHSEEFNRRASRKAGIAAANLLCRNDA